MSSADPAHTLNVWAWRRAPHVCHAHRRALEPIGVTLELDTQRVEIACQDSAGRQWRASIAFPWHFELPNV